MNTMNREAVSATPRGEQAKHIPDQIADPWLKLLGFIVACQGSSGQKDSILIFEMGCPLGNPSGKICSNIFDCEDTMAGERCDGEELRGNIRILFDAIAAEGEVPVAFHDGPGGTLWQACYVTSAQTRRLVRLVTTE
jgi:hypothetical protein